ncbi:hypothetical protein GQ600_22439 [Phytophthora cactorum]|nr:hypothetical protein GQ600_22439 [Phytophthora cactorum]
MVDICHFLAYNLHVRGLNPASQFFHKVVIIGDDFAAGIGDYISVGSAGGGIAEYLKKIVAIDDKASEALAMASNGGRPVIVSALWASSFLRLNKIPSVLTAGSSQLGHHQCGSAWIHDCRLAHVVAQEELVLQERVYLESHERRVHRDHHPRIRGDQVGTRMFVCQNALLSSQTNLIADRNSSSDGHEMKRHLMEICDTLRKKGKQVCLATVASPDPTASEMDSASSTLNTALEQFCKSTSTEEAPVILGPRLDTYAFRRESALSYDKYHFNSQVRPSLLALSFAIIPSFIPTASSQHGGFLDPHDDGRGMDHLESTAQQVTYDKALYD